MDNMPPWLLGFGRSLKKRLTSLWGRILTLFSLVGFLGWILDHATGDTVFEAGKKFFSETLPKWAAQPIGHFWLVAFTALFVWAAVWLVIVLVLSWKDNRPAKNTGPMPLTAVEDEEIQPIREVWNRWGRDASTALHHLFTEVVSPLKEQHWWAALLDIKGQNLQQAQRKMDAALARDARVRREELIELFRETYGYYLIACRWLARINANAVNIEAHPLLASWQVQHQGFSDRLQGLVERPSYSQMGVDPVYGGDVAYQQFMIAAGHYHR